jgi:hypothetical protein
MTVGRSDRSIGRPTLPGATRRPRLADRRSSPRDGADYRRGPSSCLANPPGHDENRLDILDLQKSQQPDAYDEPAFSSQVLEARYFHLHPGRASDRGLIVICGGRETCAPDYLIDRATFPNFRIEWVERGRGEVW